CQELSTGIIKMTATKWEIFIETVLLTERFHSSLLFKFLKGEESMKRTSLLAITALVPGMFLMQSAGNSSVAVVDFERAVEESAGKDAITKLNAFAAEQRDAIQKKANEAQDLQNKLRGQDRALSASARDQLNRNLEDAQTAVEKMSNDA